MADVIVAGDGLVGLAIALAAATRGLSVVVIGRPLEGSASGAAAGLLAPSLGHASDAARAFMLTARDEYPEFVAQLAHDSGQNLSVNTRGIIEIAEGEEGFRALSESRPPESALLDQHQLARLEPALRRFPGAVLHPGDGAVNNVTLLNAMRAAVARNERIRSIQALVWSVDLHDTDVSVSCEDGSRYSAETLAVAAGAWCPRISGMPRKLPVEPVLGQMLAVDAAPVTHAISAPGCYIVPRGHSTVVGSTMEYTGFQVATSAPTIARLQASAGAMCEELATAERSASWAGLRPVTPDMLPILGAEPDAPRLLYACGHSKNGVLLAPLTGRCIAALAAGDSSPMDLSAFAVDRFARS